MSWEARSVQLLLAQTPVTMAWASGKPGAAWAGERERLGQVGEVKVKVDAEKKNVVRHSLARPQGLQGLSVLCVGVRKRGASGLLHCKNHPDAP